MHLIVTVINFLVSQSIMALVKEKPLATSGSSLAEFLEQIFCAVFRTYLSKWRFDLSLSWLSLFRVFHVPHKQEKHYSTRPFTNSSWFWSCFCLNSILTSFCVSSWLWLIHVFWINLEKST